MNYCIIYMLYEIKDATVENFTIRKTSSTSFCKRLCGRLLSFLYTHPIVFFFVCFFLVSIAV